jgi:hypothetical protein
MALSAQLALFCAHKQQSAMNDGNLFPGQATSLINLNSCNRSQHVLKACLWRQASQSLSVEQRHCEPAHLSSRLSAAHFVSHGMIRTLVLFVMAEAHKIVPSRARVNETSVDRAPRLRKPGPARSSRGHCAFNERIRQH